MAEEMANFYEEEDLYTYMEGSTPSLDQASLTGFTGEDDEKIVLVTKEEIKRKLVGHQHATEVTPLARNLADILKKSHNSL